MLELSLHEVRIKAAWSPHCLAGVVKHEIEPVVAVAQVAREHLDARRVP
jgi:hypothetical protein